MRKKQMNSNWLPYHINAVPKRGYGNRLTMYLMTLEAWRRGLKASFYLKENSDNRLLIRYKISDGENTYKFNSSLGEKITEEAFDICDNKDKTKEYLQMAKIDVPQGQLYKIDERNEEIFSYAKELGYPVVLKPTNANTGKGVHANVKDENELKDAIYTIKNLGYTEVIIEEKIEGTEYRILVLHDKVLAIVKRLPANIVGNGQNTIKELIEMKNKDKNSNPNLYNRFIQVDKEIKKVLTELNYDLDTILPKNERVYLREKVALDGDPIDATELLSQEEKDISVEAVKSIPGLHLCGLDVIINHKEKRFTVIEMNTRPMLGLHLFPIEGKPIDVVSPIIDYYFPETKNKIKSNLYYDFQSVIAPIKDRSVKEVSLEPLNPIEPLHGKYIIADNFDHINHLTSEINPYARRLRINGNIKELPDNKWRIVMGSQNKQNLNAFLNYLKQQIINTEIQVLSEGDWKYPINIGFKSSTISKYIKNNKRLRGDNRRLIDKSKKLKEKNLDIIDKNKALRIQNEKMKNTIKKLERQCQVTEENNYQLQKKLNDIINSKSWRITIPLRRIMKLFNKNGK